MTELDTANFEIFNRVTLTLLVQLFEEFPGYLKTNAAKLTEQALPRDIDGIDETIWHDLNISEDTITWLESEGFITYQTKGGQQYVKMRLTLKGLSLLGYSPPSIEGYSNIAEQAKNVLAEGTKDAASEVVKSIFLGAMKYIPAVFT